MSIPRPTSLSLSDWAALGGVAVGVVTVTGFIAKPIARAFRASARATVIYVAPDIIDELKANTRTIKQLASQIQQVERDMNERLEEATSQIVQHGDAVNAVPVLQRDVAVFRQSLDDMGRTLERMADSLDTVVGKLIPDRRPSASSLKGSL